MASPSSSSGPLSSKSTELTWVTNPVGPRAPLVSNKGKGPGGQSVCVLQDVSDGSQPGRINEIAGSGLRSSHSSSEDSSFSLTPPSGVPSALENVVHLTLPLIGTPLEGAPFILPSDSFISVPPSLSASSSGEPSSSAASTSLPFSHASSPPPPSSSSPDTTSRGKTVRFVDSEPSSPFFGASSLASTSTASSSLPAQPDPGSLELKRKTYENAVSVLSKLIEKQNESKDKKSATYLQTQHIILSMRDDITRLKVECASGYLSAGVVPGRINGEVTEATEALITEMAKICCKDTENGSVERLSGGTGAAFKISYKNESGIMVPLFVFKPVEMQPGGKFFQGDKSDYMDELVKEYFDGAKGIEVRDYVLATSPFSSGVAAIASLNHSEFKSGLELEGSLVQFVSNDGSLEDLTTEEKDGKLQEMGFSSYQKGDKSLEDWFIANVAKEKPKILISQEVIDSIISNYLGAIYYLSSDINAGNILLNVEKEAHDLAKISKISFIDNGQSIPMMLDNDNEASLNQTLIMNASPLTKWINQHIIKHGFSKNIQKLLDEFDSQKQFQIDQNKFERYGLEYPDSAKNLQLSALRLIKKYKNDITIYRKNRLKKKEVPQFPYVNLVDKVRKEIRSRDAAAPASSSGI